MQWTCGPLHSCPNYPVLWMVVIIHGLKLPLQYLRRMHVLFISCSFYEFKKCRVLSVIHQINRNHSYCLSQYLMHPQSSSSVRFCFMENRKIQRKCHVCACLSVFRNTQWSTPIAPSSNDPSGLLPFQQRATEINRVLDHGSWRRTPWWIDLLHQSSESINHPSLGAGRKRNFPHSAAVPAATERYLWGWITRLH